MFGKKSGDDTGRQRKIKENDYLDGLCELAVDRQMKEFTQTANTRYIASESVDRISTDVCEALVKGIEHELWVRIAPRVVERVKELKQLALDATGENKIL